MEQKENYLLIKLNISLFYVKQRNLLSNSISLKTNFLCIPIQFEMFEVCVSVCPGCLATCCLMNPDPAVPAAAQCLTNTSAVS